MQYPHIIALIDSYLERLYQVRQLLTETETLPKKAEEKASSAPTSSTVAAETQVSPAMELPQTPARRKANPGSSARNTRPSPGPLEAAESPLPEAESVPSVDEPLELQHGPAEAQRQRRPAAILPFSSRARKQTHRRASASGASSDDAPAKALVGIVPLTPVFISAEKLRQEKASKHQQQDLPTVHLTAESLAQRWTHSIH